LHGGLVVNDETWEIGAYDTISIWGHHAPTSGALLPYSISNPDGVRT
jgi:hypothetical protein